MTEVFTYNPGYNRAVQNNISDLSSKILTFSTTKMKVVGRNYYVSRCHSNALKPVNSIQVFWPLLQAPNLAKIVEV